MYRFLVSVIIIGQIPWFRLLILAQVFCVFSVFLPVFSFRLQIPARTPKETAQQRKLCYAVSIRVILSAKAADGYNGDRSARESESDNHEMQR